MLCFFFAQLDLTDFYDDDYDMEESDNESNGSDFVDGDDSGNEES
jgi:ubiquitin-conjugating enzyme E2 R